MPPSSQHLLLAQILPKRVYYDLRSVERYTRRTKPKYKLCGHFVLDLGIFPFFILTSKSGTHTAALTLRVRSAEWEERTADHLHGDSYICIKANEILTKSDIIPKLARNEFTKVAKISDAKFEEFKSLMRNIHPLRKPVSRQCQDIINLAFAVDTTAENILRDLGL